MLTISRIKVQCPTELRQANIKVINKNEKNFNSNEQNGEQVTVVLVELITSRFARYDDDKNG